MFDMEIYPIKFKSIYKERIWGGRKLEEYFNKQLPENSVIGESWELSGLPGDESVVTNGPLTGKNIDQLIKEYPNEILGKKKAPKEFPLLIKLLDAQDDLSVQVHPDDDACKRMGKGASKTECWYIVDMVKDACIYKGLKPGTTKEQFSTAIKAGKCDELLIKVPVKKGQCHFLPSGTVHAIGAGLLVAEIQQPSDTTYRVFDWNRTDASGKSRELHVEDSLDCIHFNQDPSVLTVEDTERLVECEHFNVDKFHEVAGSDTYFKAGKMKIFTVIEGTGAIATEGQDPIKYTDGDTVLLPAAWSGLIEPVSETQALLTTL